ncbi:MULTISPECIES: DUF1772 domain-containing protein [unclassified Pseudactinotalea]|uniref:anthrone oxygenase family protein n=1 Tax=unclassified Pseudactinotalea TaxID=2649176 RepID=UPI00128AE2F8|nr:MULTISPECIES: anthrone oxygenase family protein [unclassified Pseudactinotalea]MPV51252.1 DUF1772 domain-containing protein [Pseudactinotalea sp. HY160]QGH69665.1 DUF1772 domain-containing protein [Pseudactinotalea sp. HY158]
MMEGLTRALTVAAAIGAGLGAGVYLAFSTFIMPGLRPLAPPQAIAAMNSINKAAPASRLLMLVLFGAGALCVLVLIAGLRHLGDPAAWWQIAGAALYLVSVAILVGYHVPHNDRLMQIDLQAVDAGAVWSRFYTGWMAWNLARTLTAVAGAVGLTLALRAH